MDDSQKSNYAALMEESARLAQKLRTAPAGDRNAIQMRIDDVFAESCRVLGMSETDIAASQAISKTQVKSETQREVRIGLALYQRALRGDDTAIAKLRRGSFEFAVAIGEGAISTDDLRKLPFADVAAKAAHDPRLMTWAVQQSRQLSEVHRSCLERRRKGIP